MEQPSMTRAAFPAWAIDTALDPERIKRISALGMHRWDGNHPPADCCGLCDREPRTVLAGARFYGGPGRGEEDAALAWATELKVFFGRGTGEPPVVKSYLDGIYTVVGLITTTHPSDRPGPDGIVWFT